MSRYVLVHGAAHGGWCWSKVSAVLSSLGHHVVAPDLPGCHGTDIDPADTTMDDYVSSLLDLLKQQLEPVILVGHSMAGFVMTLAAQEAPGKVRRLVYVAAYVPQAGNSINSLIGADKDSLLLEAFDVSTGRVFAVSKPGHVSEACLQRLR